MNSRDVRHMKQCSQCGELGIYKPRENSDVEMPLVICTNSLRTPGRSADYQHPECYGADTVFLPDDELIAIRICDVCSKTMRKILAKRGGKNRD